LNAFVRRRILFDLGQRQSGVSKYADQQVVEVVCDPAGQNAETFELLHVLHLRFEAATLLLRPHAIGHVPVTPDAAIDQSVHELRL
jgi:hypothetical protein